MRLKNKQIHQLLEDIEHLEKDNEAYVKMSEKVKPTDKGKIAEMMITCFGGIKLDNFKML